jgi:F-type H+-transporting ATPase subunit epsilon
MAKSDALSLTVITPEHQVLDTTAEAVVVPAHDGELGVLNGRAPLMCELGIGQLRYTAHGETRRLFIDGGFAQVFENRVTVLANRSLPEEQITRDVIQQAENAASAQPGAGAEAREQHDRDVRRLSALRALARGR